MVDYGKFDINDFSKRDKTLISLVRVTFHKKDFKEALIQIQNLKELGYNVSANIMGIIRDNKFIIPKKNDTMYHLDKIYIIINSSQMVETLDAFGHNEKMTKKILIIGGEILVLI